MAHTHSVIDDDLRFIIDPSTREIGNGSQKVKLMQYDHNSEQFTFEIPRFVEGHDMSLCNSIRVNYININKSTREQHPGVYEVSDIKVEEDNIIFSWLVSRNATQYVGPLNFLIKFMCFDENDYITYEWHTDIFKRASVSTGMNNEESIEEVYPDILEKWKSDVLAEEASRITAESERVTAESERVTAESERATAESERATAESERVAAESERVTAESERVSAESERVTAESKRVTAESERANAFAGYETEINQFKNEIVTGKDFATDNTKFAIGEAEPNLEVPTMEEFNKLAEDMTGKLAEPAEGLAVGKYFRVAALDENGHAVLEAVDAKTVGVQDVQVNGESIVADGVAVIPNAGVNKYGIVKLTYGDGSGTTFANETIYVVPAFNNVIDNRKPENGYSSGPNNRHSLVPAHLDYAVKAAMCDGKGAAWTADEQAAARERIGLPGNFELVADIELTETTRLVSIKFENYLRELYVVFSGTATNNGNAGIFVYFDDDTNRKYAPTCDSWMSTSKRYAIAHIRLNQGIIYSEASKSVTNNEWASAALFTNLNGFALLTETQKSIRAINIASLNTYEWCAECKFTVYGVRA